MQVFVITVLLGGGWSLPITRSTKILVHCPDARGDSNCDWKCYQAFSDATETSEYVLGRDIKANLRRIDGDCDIPMTSYFTARLESYCLVPQDEGFVYAAVLPRIKDDLGLKISSDTPVQTNVQVESTKFGQSSCTRGVEYEVRTSSERTLENICSYGQISRSVPDEPERYIAPTSFGFTKLSLNVTEWSRAEEERYLGVGTLDKLVEMATKSNCHAEPSGMQLYHSANFTVNSKDLDGSIAALTITTTTLLMLLTLA